MGWLAAIGAFFKLVLLILEKWGEMDKEKKAKQAEIIKEVQNAIKDRDASALNLALTKRVR